MRNVNTHNHNKRPGVLKMNKQDVFNNYIYPYTRPCNLCLHHIDFWGHPLLVNYSSAIDQVSPSGNDHDTFGGSGYSRLATINIQYL